MTYQPHQQEDATTKPVAYTMPPLEACRKDAEVKAWEHIHATEQAQPGKRRNPVVLFEFHHLGEPDFLVMAWDDGTKTYLTRWRRAIRVLPPGRQQELRELCAAAVETHDPLGFTLTVAGHDDADFVRRYMATVFPAIEYELVQQ